MDRRVTPPKQFTSLIWGPTPPCKQALSFQPAEQSEEGIIQSSPTRMFLLMADGAVEEQFPQPIAAVEEAQVAPGRGKRRQLHNLDLHRQLKMRRRMVLLVHNLGVCFHGTLCSCLFC